MRADIVKRANAFLSMTNNERLMAYLEQEVIANIRQICLHTSDEPRFAPEIFPLELGVIFREIAFFTVHLNAVVNIRLLFL